MSDSRNAFGLFSEWNTAVFRHCTHWLDKQRPLAAARRETPSPLSSTAKETLRSLDIVSGIRAPEWVRLFQL